MSSDKRESKSFLDSGCQAVDSRRIPGQLDSGFRILFFSGTWISDSNCSWDLGSLSCVPDSKKKTQTNKETKFWNPDSLIWGVIWRDCDYGLSTILLQ